VPTYNYRCDRCERTFEVRQRISEAALTTCDRCGGPIHRLLAPAPFILKGGGWYVTDYPSEGRKKGMEAEKKSGSEAAPATSTTSGSDSAGSAPAPAKSGGTSSDASAATTTKSVKSGGTSSDASAATAPKSTSTTSS